MPHNRPPYTELDASVDQQVIADVFATDTKATAMLSWFPDPIHDPVQIFGHAFHNTSEPTNLFHCIPGRVTTAISSWSPDYMQPEHQEWDPYAAHYRADHPDHALFVMPHHELSATWPVHDPYSQQVTGSFASSAISARQNNPSATLWPDLDSSHSPDRNHGLVLDSPPGQLWPTEHSQLGCGEPMHWPASTHLSTSLPRQSQAHQELLNQKKHTKIPSSFVERQQKVKISKRQGPLQDGQRERTHAMRKSKRICVRCRFYKSGCDQGDPCKKCRKITGHARSFREPCYRVHLEDTSLVRHCNGREQQEEADFLHYDWLHNGRLYEMDILWNLPKYGPISGAQPMRVTYSPYVPQRGHVDTITSVWVNREGYIQQPVQPAFAVYDTASLLPAFDSYFSSLQPAIEDWVFARVRQDRLAILTFQEAARMRDEGGSKALSLAMRLLGLSVVSQGYGTVWSDNTSCIHAYDYRTLGTSHYEAYDRDSCDQPLPGAMTHQMDVAAVKCMVKLEKAFVKELAALIFKPKIKPWYELLLTFFVIFWNLEYIHQGAHSYIQSKTGTPIASQVSKVVTAQIKKWESAFPVLLYHWRCILRSYSPFKIARDNPEELRKRGHIDLKGFEYVVTIARLFDGAKLDRVQPPLTGFSATHWSMTNTWMSSIFREAGA